MTDPDEIASRRIAENGKRKKSPQPLGPGEFETGRMA